MTDNLHQTIAAQADSKLLSQELLAFDVKLLRRWLTIRCGRSFTSTGKAECVAKIVVRAAELRSISAL